MMFTDFWFIWFFLLILAVANIVLIKKDNPRKVFLTIASYVFYGFWNWKFCSLILLSTLIDYYSGWKIYNANDDKTKRRFLLLSVVFNLSILAFFKYFNFFLDNFNFLFGLSIERFSILLPVGISFYTFQTMSYTIDIYLKKMNPEKKFINFAFFVSFFPQLVAGPIVRASEFLPQTHKPVKINSVTFSRGLQIFMYGIFKKVIIADRMAFFADKIFMSPELYAPVTIWLGVIAYAIQIFCDFSGYSDMAIGIAKMLGYNLVQNFNMPYISTSITEFWRRWHMSLSRWIRDYIYISLGGNRKGKVRQYVNLIITMLLGGLWHGASWNFVVWGGMHGIGLAIEKLLNVPKRIGTKLTNFLGWIITMVFVLISWVFFRATSFDSAFVILQKMFLPIMQSSSSWHNVLWYSHQFVFYLIVVVIMHFVGVKLSRQDKKYLFFSFRKFKTLVVFFILVMYIVLFWTMHSSPFIYFQF